MLINSSKRFVSCILSCIMVANCDGGGRGEAKSVDYCPTTPVYENFKKKSQIQYSLSDVDQLDQEEEKLYQDIPEEIHPHVKLGAETRYQYHSAGDDLASSNSGKSRKSDAAERTWVFGSTGNLGDLAVAMSELDQESLKEDETAGMGLIASLIMFLVELIVGLIMKKMQDARMEDGKVKIEPISVGPNNVMVKNPSSMHGNVSLWDNVINGISCSGKHVGHLYPEEKDKVDAHISNLTKTMSSKLQQASMSAHAIFMQGELASIEAKEQMKLFKEGFNRIFEVGTMKDAYNDDKTMHSLDFMKKKLKDEKLAREFEGTVKSVQDKLRG